MLAAVVSENRKLKDSREKKTPQSRETAVKTER
jgi:hypothetical protein